MIEFGKPSEEFKRLNPHLFDVGQKPPSVSAAPSKLEIKEEKELQRLIYLDLNRRGLYFHYQRSDKKTTGTVGSPDFILPYKGQFVALECKTEIGRLSPTQTEVLEKIEAQDGCYYVIRSFQAYERLMGFRRLQKNASDNEVP